MSSPEHTDMPFMPKERIDLLNAIAAFTTNAAPISIIADITGSLDVGKFADSWFPAGAITCAYGVSFHITQGPRLRG
jgi:hypothetical protein